MFNVSLPESLSFDAKRITDERNDQNLLLLLDNEDASLSDFVGEIMDVVSNSAFSSSANRMAGRRCGHSFDTGCVGVCC